MPKNNVVQMTKPTMLEKRQMLLDKQKQCDNFYKTCSGTIYECVKCASKENGNA